MNSNGGTRPAAMLALAVILIVQSTLLVHRLTAPAIWQDEALSYFVAVDGPLAAIERISHDTQGPLYYVALSIWLNLGHDLFTMRLLSVVATLIATVFVFAGTRALTGVGVALLAAGLFAISPDTILWGQKVRPYALQSMLVAISWWGFCRAVARHVAAEPKAMAGWRDIEIPDDRAAPGFRVEFYWIVYAVGAGLAMLTQHPAGFYILGCCVAVMLVFGRNPRRNRVFLINWFIAQCLASAIWLSWMPIFLSQATAHLTAETVAAKHPHFLVESIWLALAGRLGSDFIWTGLPALLTLDLCLMMFGLYSATRQKAPVVLAHYTLLVPLAVCAGLFFTLGPLFGYVITVLKWEQMLLAIVLAHAVFQVSPIWLRALILFVLIAFEARGIANHYGMIPHRHDQISELIRQEARRGDVLIYNRLGTTHLAMSYYLRDLATPLDGLEGHFPYRGLVSNVAAVKCNDRIWMVIADGDPPAVRYEDIEAIAALSLERRVGGMLVRRYDRKAQPDNAGVPCQ